MATKSENADIAVLQEQMKGMTEDMTEVKATQKKILEKLDDSYVKKDEFRAFKWTTIPITVIVTVILTFLVTFFLQKITERPNNPTTSTTTTTTTPTGSTAETRTSDTSQSTPQTSSAPPDPSTQGGVQIELPKLP